MKSIYLPFVALFLVYCSSPQQSEPPEEEVPVNPRRVEVLSEAGATLIDAATGIAVLSGGFTWSEGPVWVDEDGGYLLFSDIPPNKIYKWDGDTSTYLQPSGYTGDVPRGGEPGSNGLALDAEGRLVLCQHGDRQIGRMEAPLHSPEPQFVALADNYEGQRFNSPNDLVFDSNGNLYFTDPPYGLVDRMEDPAKEIPFQGVYCLLTTGETVLLDSTVTRPNGIALSPDESKLYVAVSDPKHAAWYQYDISAPGSVTGKQLLYDATSEVGQEGKKGLPDGMKMHPSGHLFATGPGGVFVFDPQGTVVARIFTGQATANCGFTSDYKTLFMTADDYLMSVAMR
ncbi:MAG: SMP-30/gluconolactonase/LRE family protein [Bacteroidota bacterium]